MGAGFQPALFSAGRLKTCPHILDPEPPQKRDAVGDVRGALVAGLALEDQPAAVLDLFEHAQELHPFDVAVPQGYLLRRPARPRLPGVLGVCMDDLSLQCAGALVRVEVVHEQIRRIEVHAQALKDSRRDEPSLLYSVSNLIKRGIFYSFSMTRSSFISDENFVHNVYSLVDDLAIGETKIPFYPVAADLETGEEAVLTSGSLRRGVLASSGRSVPLYNDKHLAYNWAEAKWMYDRAKERQAPLMAGSSLPTCWRPWSPFPRRQDRPPAPRIL